MFLILEALGKMIYDCEWVHESEHDVLKEGSGTLLASLWVGRQEQCYMCVGGNFS